MKISFSTYVERRADRENSPVEIQMQVVYIISKSSRWELAASL